MFSRCTPYPYTALLETATTLKGWPTIMRLSREEALMRTAEVTAERSTCSRRKVGAVVARDSRIISTGYNGAPTGMPHCNHRLDELPSHGCPWAVHAEANALVFAARHGITTANAQLFTTLSPCVECAKLMVNAGISVVWFRHDYRDPSGVELLEAAGVVVRKLA